MKFSGIHEVEDLHHHKSIEYKCEVPWRAAGDFKNFAVVLFSIGEVKSTTTNSATHDAVVPLILWVSFESSAVQLINILWNQVFSSEDQGHHHWKLEDTLSNDMLQHGLGNDVLISGMGTSFKKTLLRVFGCEGKRGKGIHDQVDPKHLNGFENFGLEDCCTY
jgi:hypothetical protein